MSLHMKRMDTNNENNIENVTTHEKNPSIHHNKEAKRSSIHMNLRSVNFIQYIIKH